MGVCVFCGFEGRLTAEHVFPRWLEDVLPPGAAGALSTVEQGPSNRMFTTRQWECRGYNWTVRAVCRECNNGWLSELEGQAKKVLTPMIRGGSTRLTGHARRVLAAWAVKTIIVSHSKEAGSRVPADHYARLREDRVAPPGTTVWIGAVDPRPARLVSLRHYDVSMHAPALGTRHGAYCGTLSVGRVVLQVLGHDDEDRVARALTTNARAALVQVWPAPAPVAMWPPATCLDLESLSALADDMLTPKVLRLQAA